MIGTHAVHAYTVVLTRTDPGTIDSRPLPDRADTGEADLVDRPPLPEA